MSLNFNELEIFFRLNIYLTACRSSGSYIGFEADSFGRKSFEKLIFFENVKGFTLGFKNNEKKGKAYSKYVVEELESLGYSVKGQLIDFSKFGVPQKRTRFILVGIQNDFLNQSPNLNKYSFFEGIENNKEPFLISKNLSMNPSLGNAISDLLQANGEIDSETPNFKEGVYGKPASKYQKYIRKYSRKNSRVESHR